MKVLKIIRNIVLILLGLTIVALVVYWFNFRKVEVKKEEKILDNIKKFGYTLSDRKNDYYKSEFQNLKKALDRDTVDYDLYAESLTKLFISDLFTINDKVSTGDVGGAQLVYEPYKSAFISYAKDSLYSGVLNNADGKRNQALPTVKNVEITNKTQDKFKYAGTDYDSYVLTGTIEYTEDMGYQSEFKLTLIKVEDKLFVAKLG